MRRNIIFLLMLLFLSGCTANYDLYIGEKFTDDIMLIEKNDKLDNIKHYDMYEETDFNIENLSYQIYDFESGFDYNREEIYREKESGYRYNYTYNSDKMSEKSMVYDCYDSIFIEQGKEIIIETSNSFKCFDKYGFLDEVIVNIHYGGELIDTNADSYEKGIYTWNINKERSDNEKIYLRIKKIQKNYTFNIIGAIIFGLVTIVSVVIILRYNKNNT